MTPALPRSDRAATLRGIAMLCAGIAVFSIQDMILKLVSGGYPLHQAMVLRSLTAMPLLLWVVMRDGGLGTLVTPGMRAMIGRGGIMFLAYMSYYLALPALPIATTVALYFAGPLFIMALSVAFLGERVPARRWLAVAAGFAGVVVMVRPGGAVFDWAALLPIVSGLTYGISMVMARRMGGRETAAALAFWGNAVFLAAALALALALGDGRFDAGAHPSLSFLLRGWVWPTPLDLALMCACGGVAAAGLVLLTAAYRGAPANAVAPFEYTGMIWGVLWGWSIFGDWPDALAWAGIALIVGAGLAVLWPAKTGAP
jgi:drug/metabolite transporter (DMT)-like permease